MRSRRETFGWIAAAGAVAFVVSTLTVIGESRLRPSGSFRVVVTGGNPSVTRQHMATFMPDGGVVGSVIPVNCLEPGQSMSEAHGEWTVRVRGGVPILRFHLEADLYSQPSPTSNDDEVTYDGAVVVDGSAPLTFGPVKGEATMTFPGRCAERYDGQKLAFIATEIEAVPSTKP